MLIGKRKVLVLAGAFIIYAFTVSIASAGFGLKLPKVPGFGGDSGGSASLKQNAARFSKFLSIGTTNLLRAVANMQDAVGNKELAEQIRLQAASLKKAAGKGEETEEDYEKAFATIDESGVDREEFSKVPAERGRVYAVKSAINIGVGGVADAKALSLASDMMSNPPSATDLLDGGFRQPSI